MQYRKVRTANKDGPCYIEKNQAPGDAWSLVESVSTIQLAYNLSDKRIIAWWNSFFKWKVGKEVCPCGFLELGLPVRMARKFMPKITVKRLSDSGLGPDLNLPEINK